MQSFASYSIGSYGMRGQHLVARGIPQGNRVGRPTWGQYQLDKGPFSYGHRHIYF